MKILSFIIVTFSLLALHYSPTPTKATLIEAVCSNTSNPDACSQILRPDVRASSASTLIEFGEVIVQMEIEALEAEINVIEGLKRNRGYPPNVHGILNSCNLRCNDTISLCAFASYDIRVHKFGNAKVDFYDMGHTMQYCRAIMVDWTDERLSRKNDETMLIGEIGGKAMLLLERHPPVHRND